MHCRRPLLPNTYLRKPDLARRFTQYFDDQIEDAGLRKHTDLLRQADLIFVDGPKDGTFEPRLFATFGEIGR